MLLKFQILIEAAKNFMSGSRTDLTYISEGAHWIIRAIGNSLVTSLNDQGLLKARQSITHFGVKSPLVHFGSIHALLTPKRTNLPPPPTKTIVTWFHIEPGDTKVQRLRDIQNSVARIHTACTITKNQLISAGLDASKISVIPLGINLELFKPWDERRRQELRQRLGITPDAMVIGSFQKDGVGWGDGDEPKLIKGPDIFLKVIERLMKEKKMHIVLTGPSRGYVKKGLAKLGVPFTHIPYVKDARAVAPYYQALDLYLVTARIEGGPMAILESWASGVPVVATRVGMVPDIATDNKNVLIADVEDIDGLVMKGLKVLSNPDLAHELVANGFAEVMKYDWDIIARRYYNELYGGKY